MPLHPGKGQPVRLCCFQQPLPQIHVFDGAGGSLPALFQPAVDPALIKGVRHIFGIRNDLYLTGTVQRLQPGDHRHQLHPVVRCPYVSAGKLPFMQLSVSVHVMQDRPVAARSFRIPPRGPVRINRYLQLYTSRNLCLQPLSPIPVSNRTGKNVRRTFFGTGKGCLQPAEVLSQRLLPAWNCFPYSTLPSAEIPLPSGPLPG